VSSLYEGTLINHYFAIVDLHDLQQGMSTRTPYEMMVEAVNNHQSRSIESRWQIRGEVYNHF
jgi:hypothetical protein